MKETLCSFSPSSIGSGACANAMVGLSAPVRLALQPADREKVFEAAFKSIRDSFTSFKPNSYANLRGGETEYLQTEFEALVCETGMGQKLFVILKVEGTLEESSKTAHVRLTIHCNSTQQLDISAGIIAEVKFKQFVNES